MNITQTLQSNGPEQPAIAHLDESEHYRLLADDRRRRVLELVAAGDAPIPAADLADRLATPGPATDAGSATDDILLSLHHVHLPMLADAGVIDYNPANAEVIDTVGLEH